MAKFKKGNIPWNKGLKSNRPKCPKCGQFISKRKGEHVCKAVELRGKRYCAICGKELSNQGWERYQKRCGSCGKKLYRENERLRRRELRSLFGGKCQVCSYNKYEFRLAFHHIDGRADNERNKKVSLREVRDYPNRFGLLCLNCHKLADFGLIKIESPFKKGSKLKLKYESDKNLIAMLKGK